MKSISVLRLAAILLCCMYLLGFASLQAQVNKWVNYTPNLITVLKNPAMGWMMYEEGWSFQGTRHNKSNIYTPEVFWEQMEECKAADYANILYIRMLWKDLEPEEGKYAWIYNEQYKWYIQKAKDKGLKLAFRVFFHGVDGVPSYVYEAGATESPIDDEGKTQPYYDNPVFLEKLDKFVEAFAKEYDNPDEVDYIDAYGLGRWGEGHGLALEKKENLETVIRQVTGSYARHFKKVLTVMNLSQSDYRFSKPLVYDKLGFLPRRDGIGSFWFSNEERAMVHDELFPKRALIGEGCWWFNAQNGDNSKYKHFQGDKRFAMNDFKEAFIVSVTDALDNHCNTLDLRVPLQCKFWIEELPDQVQRFITFGGYRLYPDYIKVEQNNRTLTLFHSWKNYGVGVLSNNHPNWNYKYQVSFVLMNERQEIVFLHTEPEAEPSEWLKGMSYNYLSQFDIPAKLRGKYTLCVGLTDKTKNNEAAIDLAVSEKLKIGKWIFVVGLEL